VAATTLAADPPAPAQNPARPAAQQQQLLPATPPLPSTPAGVKGLLYARPFVLDQGYEFEWRAEHPVVKAGWLLVLDVDPALVYPRQVAEPILYVGKTTGERVNIGQESGRIVVIVPSDLNDKGEVALDLNEARMWFGTPGLPEQVDQAMADAELRRATNNGIAPFAREVVDLAKSKADAGVLHAADRASLRHSAAELIKLHSPQETELADQIMAEHDDPQAQQQPARK